MYKIYVSGYDTHFNNKKMTVSNMSPLKGKLFINIDW